MTKNYCYLMMATALATGFTLSLHVSAHAAETVQEQRLNAGFINNGLNTEVPHSSMARPVPSPAEARAALQMPDDMEPAIGIEAAAELPRTDNMRPETKQAQEAAGGPQATNAGEDPMRNGSQPGASKQAAETVGARPGNSNGAPAPAAQPRQPASAAQAGGPAPAQQGQPQSDVPTKTEDAVPPIGATGQTMPSTLSQRNDVLDRVPTMALPMPLSDADRKRIFDTVMADKAQATAGADALIPASLVPTDIALNSIQPLPESLRGIAAIDGLAYVKGESKVLLVRPATRIVYEEIRM